MRATIRIAESSPQPAARRLRHNRFIRFDDIDAGSGATQILRNHIAIVAQHYSGKVWAWDVVNEAFNADGTMRSTIWYDAPGIGLAGQGTAYIEQALGWAHTQSQALL